MDRLAYGGQAADGGYGRDNLVKVRKKRRKIGKAAKASLIIFGVLLAIILACCVALAVWVNSLDTSMGFEDEEEEQKLAGVLYKGGGEDQAFYMLVLGSDAREGDSASRSDVTMLVHVDAAAGTVHLVSIPRDTMVDLDGHGTQKINAAYAFGGAAGAVECVSEFAGVDISHYVEVHFEELERAVDSLGGIWVNVPESFEAGNGGMSLEAGTQLLDGEQALAFARERYNVSGGDYGRAQAQRLIVEGIIDAVLSRTPSELPGVVGELAECISTDLTVGDLAGLAQQFQSAGASVYSAACPSYSLTRDGISYTGTMLSEWRDMMRRVDAGLDPNDKASAIPAEQASDTRLGQASNSASPKDYAALAEEAGLTTDDVAPVEGGDGRKEGAGTVGGENVTDQE